MKRTVIKKHKRSKTLPTFPSTAVKALALDKNNVLWIGTYRGLRVLYNTSNFFTEEVVRTEPIIILEDGLPQELLAQQFISDIIVDGSNNKWISTADAGVFYVSSDGQNTIHHFTKDNSPLPSNGVNDMALDSENGDCVFWNHSRLSCFYNWRVKDYWNHLKMFMFILTLSALDLIWQKIKLKLKI